MAAHRAPWVDAPPPRAFTPAERRVIDRLRTPAAVQAYLNALPYNTERGGETLRSFRGVVRTGTAHCFEAALFAAVVLEQHGYPPLVLSFESVDLLDHVIFVYRQRGRWGSDRALARSGAARAQAACSRRRARWRSATWIRMWTSPVRCAATPSSTCVTLGTYDWRLADDATSGRPSACCWTIRTGGSGRPAAASRGSARVICASAPTIRT